MAKVGRLRFRSDLAKLDSRVALRAPRNAYVSFEVLISGGKKLKKLDARFHALQGPSTIPAREFEAFAKVWPEALVPLAQLPRGEPWEGELWVDLFVPRDVKPGMYTGSFSVNGQDVPIALKVEKAVVPDKCTLTADLNNYADVVSRSSSSLAQDRKRFFNGKYLAVEKQFFRMAHEHRSLFHLLPYTHAGFMPPTFHPELEGEGKHMRVKSWKRFDQHFGPYLDGSAFKGTKRGEIPIPFMYLPFNFDWPASYAKWGKKGYRTEFRNVLSELRQHFKKKGWVNTYFELFLNHKKRYKLFPYDGDETRFMWDDKIFRIWRDFSEGLYGDKRGQPKIIHRMDSSWAYGFHYKSDIPDFLKLWVVNRNMHSWFPESVKPMKKKGCIVWVYGGVRENTVHFNDLIGYMLDAFMRGINGFTYWTVTGWGKDLWSRKNKQAENVLMYPGERFGINGPIPGRRLKALRNAMQMSELLYKIADRQGMAAARALVNRVCGFRQSDWWGKKPFFWQEPPYTWSNQRFSDAGITRPQRALAEDVLPRLNQAALDRLEK